MAGFGPPDFVAPSTADSLTWAVYPGTLAPRLSRAQPTTGAGAPSWFEVSPERFARLPEARQVISISSLNHTLLEAAILQATNRERRKHQLKPLQYNSTVARAAAIQAGKMAQGQFVGHENPDPDLRTPLQRIRSVGLEPRLVAENVATQFARKYRSGSRFYLRQEHGETVPSETPEGPPIPMHTYGSFASALLDAWMSSPGHRANILRKEARFLGCAAVPGPKQKGIEVLYCDQVFYTPTDGAAAVPGSGQQGR